MKKRFQNILMIDNFDSFTYNLVDYFKQQGCHVKVYRNTVPVEQLKEVEFDLLVLSPGPSVPKNAGNLFEIIGHFYQRKPIFGICLGLQALIEFFGGELKYLEPKHGKADIIINDQKSIYSGMDKTIEVARYHSLGAAVVPNVFEVSANAQDGTVMSIRHKSLPIEAVQFHPESVLSMKNQVGMRIIENVVNGKIMTGMKDYQKLMHILNEKTTIVKADLEYLLKVMTEDLLTEDQKLIILVAMSNRLANAEYLHQFIEVLQAHGAIEHNAHIGQIGMDICGTGGSGLPRINTSTLAGLLLSAMGLPIIKHGNKAASGRFGSFDLLEALGVPIKIDQNQSEKALNETQLSFLYARTTYPIVGKFVSARRRVAVPTIFNVLGPLLNPYGPERQFMGTAFGHYLDLIFETAILMGKQQFCLVRADDRLDEISVSTETQVLFYKNGERKRFKLKPSDFGIEVIPFEQVQSNTPQDSLRIAKEIINGEFHSEHYKLVAVNAAFIYTHFVEEIPLPEAYNKMVAAMKSGIMKTQLEKYIVSVKGEILATV